MSLKHSFKLEFESWKKYKEFLLESPSIVLKYCENTDLENKVKTYYESSLPQKNENAIDFITRNFSQSYQSESEHHSGQIEVNMIMAKLLFYTGKIPLLKKVMRLGRISTELYLGQYVESEPKAYISKYEEQKGSGFGNDKISGVVTDLNRISDFDIDVGFENEGKIYFYKINVEYEKCKIASDIFNEVKSKFNDKKIKYSESNSLDEYILKVN